MGSRKSRFNPTMQWSDIVHFIAQGAINIAEGIPTGSDGCHIQNRSPIHKAMIGFCDHLSHPEGRRIIADFMKQRNG